MTKYKAVEMNKKMWKWVAINIERYKKPFYPNDFLLTLKDDEIAEVSKIFSNSFLCGYVENTFNNVDYDKSVGGKHLDCSKCLVDWGSDNIHEHACQCCIGYNGDEPFDNLMKQWYDCIRVNEKYMDLKKMAEIAMKISMRPVRKS